jgi:hypothetical protein
MYMYYVAILWYIVLSVGGEWGSVWIRAERKHNKDVCVCLYVPSLCVREREGGREREKEVEKMEGIYPLFSILSEFARGPFAPKLFNQTRELQRTKVSIHSSHTHTHTHTQCKHVITVTSTHYMHTWQPRQTIILYSITADTSTIQHHHLIVYIIVFIAYAVSAY